MSVHERSNVTIREDIKGRILLTGLQSVPINSIDDLLAALNHGSTIRQTDSTAINAKSSRSHAIFSLSLVQRRSSGSLMSAKEKRRSVPVESYVANDSIITTESKLHFVDLAGSERLKNTGASGERAKEGISINSGLASLGKVISQLSSRQAGSHVSYRDSKLTRLLQDSLGGNAITYMIACVTPAEFHLSETLNTVQYAQRARAIQSKPQIQQLSEDGDKQAMIDRLRAEVAFLRQQIRSTEGGDRRNGVAPDRSDRQSEREAELQNHLLDVQESYTTLSQRHAKLISELTKSDDPSSGSTVTHHTYGESAVDRMKRSRANQEQIEQVVLEYEKTIQSLEASLSTTRSSLANTESSLMERETKYACIETVNQQLHSRLQKVMDREVTNDTYVRELEMKLDGQYSGEETTAAIIAELRKEITRTRENEITNEDYISTLEERLAEAEQDMELMSREVERLEHVVERQRSLGKLDSLLFELDNMQQRGTTAADVGQLDGTSSRDIGDETTKLNTLETLREAEETALPEADNDEELEMAPEADEDQQEVSQNDDLEDLQRATAASAVAKTPARRVFAGNDDIVPSPAQSKFMAEKFETVNQELVDLRLEHESTVIELDLVSAKYQQALHALAQMQAEMQDMEGDGHLPLSRAVASPDLDSRPSSFLEDARMNELKMGGHVSSSRSLSSELSLAGESPASTEPSDITPVSKQPHSFEASSAEINRLQILLADHEHAMKMMTEQYNQLQSEHEDTLASVEELKAEVQKSKLNLPPSPGHRISPSMIRRATSQSAIGTDRAHRSLVSLRSIITENLEGQPEKMENVEVHLSAATHELQTRLERIQELEVENKNAKKEMEAKTAIISGLTRERNSLKSPITADYSVVNQMREQVMQGENEARALRESHSKKEETMRKEIEALKAAMRSLESLQPGQTSTDDGEQQNRAMQEELSQWQMKHQVLLQSSMASEKRLLTTIAELEAANATIETLQAQQASSKDGSASETAATATAMQHERQKHDELIKELKRQIDEHKKSIDHHKRTIDAHVENINSLEERHALNRDALMQNAKEIESTERELSASRERITKLESELQEHRSAVEFHKHGLKSLHESHANTVEELKLAHAGAMAEIDDQLAELQSRHEQAVRSLKAEAEKPARDLSILIAGAARALGHPTSADMIANHIQDLADEKRHVMEANSRLSGTNAELERQLGSKHGDADFEKLMKDADERAMKHQETISRLANEVANHEESLRDKDELLRKRDGTIQVLSADVTKKANMIEGLEEQLHTIYDQNHNRLSVIQAQGTQALLDAQARIVALEKEIEAHRSSPDTETGSRTNTMKSIRPHSPQNDGQARSNSITSNLRKSASAASLPSPPPAIPLPPLPSLPSISVNQSGPVPPGTVSPTQSRHGSKELNSGAVKDHSQLVEDLESRVRTIEKHLHAEKQLTATLEEALVDLETQSTKIRSDVEAWKKKAWQAEEELQSLKKEKRSERSSIQAVEEEKNKRREAEAARAHLEERMQALSRKKKKNALNCF
jgi:DNA repair exonuclease SbcCD ATPase subunit